MSGSQGACSCKGPPRASGAAGPPGWGAAGRPRHAGNGNVASQVLLACFLRASCVLRACAIFVRASCTLRMSSRSAAARSRAASALRSASRSASAVACQGAGQLSDICRLEKLQPRTKHNRGQTSRGSAKRRLTPCSSLRTGGTRADLAGSKLGPDRPLLVEGLCRRGAFGK
jgi:hypothetical protein